MVDVLRRFRSLRLVKDSKGEPSSQWPHKFAIINAKHHVNKDINAFPNSTIHAIQVDTQAQLVTIDKDIEGWAVYGLLNAVDGILATLLVVFNPPDVRAIAHTAFELKRSRFLKAEPNKRKEILILRPRGENFSYLLSCSLPDHSVQERTGAVTIETTPQISNENFLVISVRTKKRINPKCIEYTKNTFKMSVGVSKRCFRQ